MKNRIFSSLFITTLFLVLVHSPFSYAQQDFHESVQLPYEQSIEMSAGSMKYFSINLSERPENVDVSISALTQRSTSPKLYVSKNAANQFPKDPNTAEYVATSFSGNIIFVPASDLAGVQTLYIGLSCGQNSKCESDLTFEYAREFNMQADGSRIIETSSTLRGASSAVVRLSIPDVPNAERIVIHVDAIPNDDNQVTSDLSVFIGYGSKIPSTNSAENIPRTSWFEGRTIVIYKNTDLFCTNCNFTLSLKFDPYSSISFEAHVFEKDMELDSTPILDGVQSERSNTYSFTVPEGKEAQDFIIDIKPQLGNPVVYINCDTRPDDMKRYYWRYNTDKATEVILTGKEHEACKSGEYFILVYSREPSVYSIRLTSKSSSKLFVGKDAPVMGDIFPNETITYEIFVPLFAAEEIIVDLKSESKLDMSIINCRFPTDCPGLLPGGIEFRHQIDNDSSVGTYNPPEFQYVTEDLPGGQQIKIDPHVAGCYPIVVQDDEFMQDPIPVCAYKITLSSQHQYPTEYTLKAISHGHQWLFVGLAKLDSVDHNETVYYMLNVPQENATKVNIQLTKFSGDVNVYVSKTQKYPDAENDETQFSHEGMIIFQNMPGLSGTYYIGVHGIETSSYSISATVMVNNKTEDYAQTLTEGLPQKGILLPNHEHPARFYKFQLDLDEDWEGVINVDVNPIKGALLVAVNNNGMIPMPNLHMWKSTGRELQITSDDEYFSPNATYYVGVFVDWSINQAAYEEVAFTVVYYVKEYSAWTDSPDGKGKPVAQQNFQHFFLSPLTPFHRSIKRTDIDYYEAFILPKDTGITLFKQADAGDVDLFVSLNPDNEYPDENQYDRSTVITHKDSIELTQEDLAEACRDSGIKLCTFYVAVIPRGDVDVIAYSLSMKRDYERMSTGPSLTPLEEGRQLQLNVPANSAPAYFYFYTVPYHPSVITISCPGEEVRIYANKNATQLGSNIKPDFAPPTPELYEFTSFTNETSNIGLAHLTIPAQNNMDSAVVTVAVYFKHPSRAGAEVDPSTTYSIVVTSQMTHIYTGKPYHGVVEAGNYMYYSLNVYKPSTTLLISMTTLDDGDPDLIVSTSRDDPPTIASHQFASISNQKTELLEINNLDIYPKTSMEGTWVIGVYGRTNSTFTLTVLDESEKMVQLKADTPFEMYLREESTMYFKYYHGKADNVEIRIDQLSGDVDAHIATVPEGEGIDVVSTLSDAANYKWEIVPSTSNTLSITTEDPKACSECLYLIIVEARLSSKLAITITEGDRFIKLQNGVTYTNQLDPLNFKKYLFSSSNAQEVTLSINLKGESLKVYASHNPEVSEQEKIWEAELTFDKPTKIMSLPKSEMEDNPAYQVVYNGLDYVKSEKNSYYIMFENPGQKDSISYTFTVTSKDSSPILKPGSKHMLSLGENQATSLIYYSSKDDQVIKLNIEFEVEVDTSSIDQSFDKILRKGVQVSGSYWSEKTTAGLGSDVELIKDHVMKDSVKSSGTKRTYVIREGFTLESKKGKYSFDLENPFSSTINVWATVYSSEFGTLQLDQNSQHSSVLSSGMSETYEVYIAKAGAWYLWTYSCLGDATVSVAENPEALEDASSQVHTMKQGQDYLYSYNSEGQNTQYARLQTMGQQDASLFVLSSKFFPTETKRYNYNLSGRTPKVQANYQYQALNSQITVTTTPLTISAYDEENDDIVYHVKLCPVKLNDPEGSQNVCNIHEECRLYQVQYKLNNQGEIKATFDRLQPGNHYVHVVADIMHKNQLIKFIPYETEMINIDKPITEQVSNNSLLIVLLALLVLIIVGFVCYKCYGRLQRFGEEKGFELPNIGKRRGYGFVGDDL